MTQTNSKIYLIYIYTSDFQLDENFQFVPYVELWEQDGNRHNIHNFFAAEIVGYAKLLKKEACF